MRCMLYTGGAACASKPSAGGAAHAFGGSERWPSFIIWRWAGPALDGWIRCRWRTLLLQRPPPPPRRTTTTTSLRPVPSRPVRGGRPPERGLPRSQPRSPARNRPGKPLTRAPRRPPGNRPPRSPPGNLPASRPRKAPVAPPSAGSQRGRARPGRRPGSGRKRAVGGASL